MTFNTFIAKFVNLDWEFIKVFICSNNYFIITLFLFCYFQSLNFETHIMKKCFFKEINTAHWISLFWTKLLFSSPSEMGCELMISGCPPIRHPGRSNLKSPGFLGGCKSIILELIFLNIMHLNFSHTALLILLISHFWMYTV